MAMADPPCCDSSPSFAHNHVLSTLTAWTHWAIVMVGECIPVVMTLRRRPLAAASAAMRCTRATTLAPRPLTFQHFWKPWCTAGRPVR